TYEWDGIWDARARITEKGWVAEIVIPFKSLRFKPGQDDWGLNVERQIKRRQEKDRWASPRRDTWISNLAAAGELSGLAGVHQGIGLDVRPFVSVGRDDGSGKFKPGLDVFKSVTSSLTASLTANTDSPDTNRPAPARRPLRRPRSTRARSTWPGSSCCFPRSERSSSKGRASTTSRGWAATTRT